jgi:REP element-mobilizing transposase RayT
MPTGLKRFHQSRQSHFVTFRCYRRRPKFVDATVYDLFPVCLENMRRRFAMRIYGYVVMSEHVHLLLSEPEQGTLADAMHYLKLSFAKRVRSLCRAQVSVQKKDANLGHQAIDSGYIELLRAVGRRMPIAQGADRGIRKTYPTPLPAPGS